MRRKVKNVGECVLITVAASVLIYLLNHMIFIIWYRNNFSDRIASMFSMTVLSVLIIFFAKIWKCNLSVFPEKFNIFYITFSVLAGVLITFSPSVLSGDVKTVLTTVYGSITVPVFEELLFRGFLWNKLKTVFKNEWTVYIINTVLFGIWHIGYIDSIAFRVDNNLAKIMFWKVITGLIFGIVLGLVRKYSKNCYASMLVHCILNTFAR